MSSCPCRWRWAHFIVEQCSLSMFFLFLFFVLLKKSSLSSRLPPKDCVTLCVCVAYSSSIPSTFLPIVHSSFLSLQTPAIRIHHFIQQLATRRTAPPCRLHHQTRNQPAFSFTLRPLSCTCVLLVRDTDLNSFVASKIRGTRNQHHSPE